MEVLRGRWLALLAVMVVSMTAVAATGFETDYTKLRTRRDVMALGSLISSVTGKNIFTVYTSYNGYGCYCGIGGKGTPVDEVDRCCQRHDQCFTVAQQGVCNGSKRSVYSNYYKYSVQKREKTDDGVHADVHCAPISKYSDVAQGMCGKAICDCDRDVATCFAKHNHNRKYNRYDRRKCH